MVCFVLVVFVLAAATAPSRDLPSDVVRRLHMHDDPLRTRISRASPGPYEFIYDFAPVYRPNRTVYLFYNRGGVTGGPATLHSLNHQLNQLGYNSAFFKVGSQLPHAGAAAWSRRRVVL